MGILESIDSTGNPVRTLWDRLQDKPGGKRLFSFFVGRAARYTGTISARVEELRPGFAKVTMRDGPRVRNHLKSVHAVALANLAEVTGNVALAYSLPNDARFIVAGMDLRYIKKARGTITGTTVCPVPATSETADYEVAVTLCDASGDVVVTATLHSRVGPKRK